MKSSSYPYYFHKSIIQYDEIVFLSSLFSYLIINQYDEIVFLSLLFSLLLNSGRLNRLPILTIFITLQFRTMKSSSYHYCFHNSFFSGLWSRLPIITVFITCLFQDDEVVFLPLLFKVFHKPFVLGRCFRRPDPRKWKHAPQRKYPSQGRFKKNIKKFYTISDSI